MLQSLVNWLIPSFTKWYPILLSFLSYSNWGWNKGLEGQPLIGWLWGWLYYLFAIFKSRSLRMSKVYIYIDKNSKWPKVSVFSSIYLPNFDHVLSIKNFAQLCTKFQLVAKSLEGFLRLFFYFQIFYNEIWLNFIMVVITTSATSQNWGNSGKRLICMMSLEVAGRGFHPTCESGYIHGS
jgi:hypothetical protein